MPAPSAADDSAAATATSSGHAPHVVMLVPRDDMLNTAPNRIDLHAHRVVALVQREHIRAEPTTGIQRKRVPVRPHAQAHTTACDVEGWQTAHIGRLHYSGIHGAFPAEAPSRTELLVMPLSRYDFDLASE
jgi:hypothetical protein